MRMDWIPVKMLVLVTLCLTLGGALAVARVTHDQVPIPAATSSTTAQPSPVAVPDPAKDPVGFLGELSGFVQSRNYIGVAALVMLLLAFGLRREEGVIVGHWAWLGKSALGGLAFHFVLAALPAEAVVMLSGHVAMGAVLNGLYAALIASGAWEWIVSEFGGTKPGGAA